MRDGAVLAERLWRTDRSHVGALPGEVAAVLREAGVEWPALGAVAVSIGPGSFTGLRIAVAFAKGLAFASDLPLVAVPTLEALAQAAGAAPGARVCAAIDARKREVYAATFEVGLGGVRRVTPDAASSPAALAAGLGAGTIVVGDAPEVYPEAFAGLTVLPFATHPPRGGVVALAGAARLARGEAASVAAFEPAYVRAPDAKLPANPLR